MMLSEEHREAIRKAAEQVQREYEQATPWKRRWLVLNELWLRLNIAWPSLMPIGIGTAVSGVVVILGCDAFPGVNPMWPMIVGIVLGGAVMLPVLRHNLDRQLFFVEYAEDRKLASEEGKKSG